MTQISLEKLSLFGSVEKASWRVAAAYATATAAATTTASNDSFSTKPNNDNFAREICVKELKRFGWFFPVDWLIDW